MDALVSQDDHAVDVSCGLPGARDVEGGADDSMIPLEVVALGTQRHKLEGAVNPTGKPTVLFGQDTKPRKLFPNLGNQAL